MNFTLEKHKFFPVIAWSLVIGFVFFTYSLTLRLSDTADILGEKTQATVASLENS